MLQAPPAGSGAESQPKSNLVHFSFKICHLVATVLMIFLRINLPNFGDCAPVIFAIRHQKNYFPQLFPGSMLLPPAEELAIPTPFFTARCYASAVLAMGLCLSVCACVCLSQVGVLLKRLNRGSHKQHHTIAQGL